MRWLKPLAEDEARRLDAEACDAKEAWHRQGLRSHHKDKQWRLCAQEELVNELEENCSKHEVSFDDPTEEEIQEWEQHGFLPPGRGGREITVRKLQPWEILNPIEDATNMEKAIFESAHKWSPNVDWVPAPLADNACFYLILFAEHGRAGDVACWAQWLGGIVPVCIDAAIDKTRGNLHDVSFWLRLIQTGRVVGAHSGPPCETYSLARWLQRDDKPAPRPLRSSRFPWGMSRRKLKEVRQLVVGNILMLRNFLYVERTLIKQRTC